MVQNKYIKSRFFFGIILLICALYGLYYWFVPTGIYGNALQVKCAYRRYACGDCFPQYKIVEVIKGSRSLKGIDLDLDFESNNLDSIEKASDKCAICLDFYIVGNLKYTRYNKRYSMKVIECYTKLRFPGCCD